MLPALLVIAQLSQFGGPPSECAPGGQTAQGDRSLTNVWERAKAPQSRRYCELVASAAAKLASGAMYADVLAILDEAERLLPGRPTTSALRGRALVAMGRFKEGRDALHEAEQRDSRALDDPFALYAYARALSHTGDFAHAMAAFHTLLPRSSVLPSGDKVAMYLEAGMLEMARGPDGIDEAISNFREAVRDAQGTGQALATAALALALDRTGDKADKNEAAALIASRQSALSHALADETAPAASLICRGHLAEGLAVCAFALESVNRSLAATMWGSYLQKTPPAEWIQHAREQEHALSGKRAAAHAPGGR